MSCSSLEASGLEGQLSQIRSILIQPCCFHLVWDSQIRLRESRVSVVNPLRLIFFHDAMGIGALHEKGGNDAGSVEGDLRRRSLMLPVTRFCVVQCKEYAVLVSVLTRLGEAEINIVGSTCKARGDRIHQVLDVSLKPSDIQPTALLIEAVPGVICCSIGSFAETMESKVQVNESVRLCVVSNNVSGVLGRLTEFICIELGLRVIFQVNRSRGRVGYNVFNIEQMQAKMNWENVCRSIECLDEIESCTLGHFSLNSLEHGLHDTEDTCASSRTDFHAEGINNEKLPRSVSAECLSKPKSGAEPLLRVTSLDSGQDLDEHGNRKSSIRRALKGGLLNERQILMRDATKLVVVMVGLPARGKSFTASKLKRFLCWRNRDTKIFNAGNYRRSRPEYIHAKESETEGVLDAERVFRHQSKEGRRIRQEAADAALNDMLKYLCSNRNSSVGIFDATNSTRERRKWILERCEKIASVVFVEVLCDDEQMLYENLLIKVRNSPDFRNIDEQAALMDLRRRIANYEESYEPIESNEVSYIKLYNLSTKVLANRLHGSLTRSLLPYMLSLHIGMRPIWFVRAGLSTSSKASTGSTDFSLVPSTKKKGVSLSEAGRKFSYRLGDWLKTSLWASDDHGDSIGKMMQGQVSDTSSFGNSTITPLSAGNQSVDSSQSAQQRIESSPIEELSTEIDDVFCQTPVKVLCSTLPRAVETARIALERLDRECSPEPSPMLNPLDKGTLCGLSTHEICRDHPDFYAEWKNDKFYQRFPGGECYLDLMNRIEPVLIEIEQQTSPVLVVSHMSCIQALLAYYLGYPVQNCMDIEVPMNTVIEILPTAKGDYSMRLYNVLSC